MPLSPTPVGVNEMGCDDDGTWSAGTRGVSDKKLDERDSFLWTAKPLEPRANELDATLNVPEAEERAKTLLPPDWVSWPTMEEQLATDFLALAALARELAEALEKRRIPDGRSMQSAEAALAKARAAGLLDSSSGEQEK
jgi:hypothetical protein